ncbi:MAG: dihydrofolate reductase [Actinomycetota bacterium]|nr:dihydrofolate reductase [Actinomycetota bacterium]
MTVTIVVAMGSDGVIGVAGDMPWHLPEDLTHFKRVTLGHPLIMGRKTYESIGRPLPGRTTIVVTRQPDWSDEGVLTAADFDEALAVASALDDEVFVVGGAQIYAEALARGVVDQMIVTHIDASPDGDTYFPDLDWSEWKETGHEPHDSMPPFVITTYAKP